MVRPVGPWLVPCGVLIRSKGPVFVLQVPSSPRGALICPAELRFVPGSWSVPCGRDPSIRTWSVHGVLIHSRGPDPFLGSWSVPGALIRPGDLIRPQGPDLSCGVLIRLAGPVFVPWIPGSSCKAVTCLAGPDSSCRAMSRGPWFVLQALIRLPGPDSSFSAPICPVGPWSVSLVPGKWQRTYLRLGRFAVIAQTGPWGPFWARGQQICPPVLCLWGRGPDAPPPPGPPLIGTPLHAMQSHRTPMRYRPIELKRLVLHEIIR